MRNLARLAAIVAALFAGSAAQSKEVEIGPGNVRPQGDGKLLGPYDIQAGPNVFLVDESGMRLTAGTARCHLVFVDIHGADGEREPWFQVWTDSKSNEQWRAHVRGDAANRAQVNCFIPHSPAPGSGNGGISDGGLVTIPVGQDHAMASGWIGIDPALDFRVDRGAREFDVALNAPGVGKLVDKGVRAGCTGNIRKSEWAGPGEHWHGELETPELTIVPVGGRSTSPDSALMRVRAAAFVRHHEESRDRLVRELNLSCTITVLP